MSLAEAFQASLDSWQPAGDGRHTLARQLPEFGWVVRLDAERVDTVGARVWELTLTRTADAPPGLTLKGWADGVAARATGLMEPLAVLEVDDAAGVALLRSGGPSRRGPDALYYEVRLTGLTEAVVRRFKANVEAGGRREQVAFALTHEVVAKLAGDVAG